MILTTCQSGVYRALGINWVKCGFYGLFSPIIRSYMVFDYFRDPPPKKNQKSMYIVDVMFGHFQVIRYHQMRLHSSAHRHHTFHASCLKPVPQSFFIRHMHHSPFFTTQPSIFNLQPSFCILHSPFCVLHSSFLHPASCIPSSTLCTLRLHFAICIFHSTFFICDPRASIFILLSAFCILQSALCNLHSSSRILKF